MTGQEFTVPLQTAAITPLHADAAKKDTLFHDRITKSERAVAHYIVQLHAPRSGESDKYMAAARRLLEETYTDEQDPKGDLLRALIPHLIDYVPEYARAAEKHSHNGRYASMPTVTFCLTDGQIITVGRPHAHIGIEGVPGDPDCALQVNKPVRVGHSGPRRVEDAPARSIRSIDGEFESQTTPDFFADRFRPAAQVLATLLAATEGMRARVLEVVGDIPRESMRNGPLRTKQLTL